MYLSKSAGKMWVLCEGEGAWELLLARWSRVLWARQPVLEIGSRYAYDDVLWPIYRHGDIQVGRPGE